jgi:hypothetical protein
VQRYLKLPHSKLEMNSIPSQRPHHRLISDRVNRTGGNRPGNRGNQSYRSGPVLVGSQPVQIQNINLNSKNKKISKNTSRCVESNGVNNFQVFVCLV